MAQSPQWFSQPLGTFSFLIDLIRFSIFYFVAIILLAHFFTPPEYRWTQNTVSDLAAQGVQYQWSTQAGFIGFGLVLNLGFLLKFNAAGKISYPDLLIMLNGLCILLTGFFSAAPYLEGMKFSGQEGNLYSLFATVAEICFTAGIFLLLVTAPTSAERGQHQFMPNEVESSARPFGRAFFILRPKFHPG